MKRTGLLTVVLLLACGAGASVARAEDGSGTLLLLENGVTKLEAKLKAGASELVTLGGKTLTATGAEAALKGCENLEGSEKDTNSCKNVTLTFTGVKQGKVNCRSEMSSGEKDPVETVLAITDLRVAGEETSTKSLAPLVLFKVLGTLEGEEELTINCGGVKNKARGVLGCLLLPGLEGIPTTKEAEVTCKINATTKDAETGTCETSCEWLKEHPFESNLGVGFEDSWISIQAKGTFNKDVFLDDCNTEECAKGTWVAIKNVGGVPIRGTNGCEFTIVNQTCQLEFVNTTFRPLRVIETKLEGVKAAERYKVNAGAGCVFNLPLGACTDEVELIKLEPKNINDYCITVEDKGTGAKQKTCAILKM
jgi:hypothetical protein